MDELATPVPPASRRYNWRHWGFNSLTISIAAHLLFGAAATYLVRQTIEHKLQRQKKQQTIMVVRFNGNVVLDYDSTFRQRLEPIMDADGWFKGGGKGIGCNVEPVESDPIDITHGELPGGHFEASLQVCKDDVEYKKDSHGNPILLLFRVASGKLLTANCAVPMYDEDGYALEGRDCSDGSYGALS